MHAYRAGLAALFLMLAAVAVQSARLGASGFYAQSAHREIEHGAFGSAEARARESLRYVSANPSALEVMGALDLASMRASRTPRDAVAAANSARERFRQALLERPSSPFLWANLALAKMYLDQVDPEMLGALRHADALGPWEPSVQQATAFVGLAAWQKLDPGMREALARTVERAGLRNAGAMYEVVKGYGRFDLVCSNARYRLLAGQNCGKDRR